MTAAGNLNIEGNINNLPTGSMSFGPITISSSAAVGESRSVSLAVGNTTVSIPAGTTAAVIVGPQAGSPSPNPPYGGAITLKGVALDTGIALSSKWPTVLTWDSSNPAPGSIVLASSVATSVQIWML